MHINVNVHTYVYHHFGPRRALSPPCTVVSVGAGAPVRHNALRVAPPIPTAWSGTGGARLDLCPLWVPPMVSLDLGQRTT